MRSPEQILAQKPLGLVVAPLKGRWLCPLCIYPPPVEDWFPK